MRKSTNPSPYTWSQFIADLFWLGVLLTVMIKITEGVVQ
jgi:hypothetical protein